MIRFLSIYLVLFSSIGLAGEREELVGSFIEASGLEKIIDSMPSQFEQQLVQRAPTAKNPEMEARVLQVFLQTIDTEYAKRVVFEYVNENISDVDLSAINEWLNSSLGSRFTQAENRQADPNFQADFLNYVAHLQSNPPEEERVETIQYFESSARMTDLTIEFLKLLMEGMLVSFSKVSEDEAYSIADLNETLDGMEMMLRELLWQQNLLVAHFTYQDFSNEEIMAYSNFLGSESGRAYMDVTIGAFTAVFNDLFEKVTPQFEVLAEEVRASAEAL